MIPRRHTPLPVLAAGCVLFLLWPGSPAAAPPHPDYDARLQRGEVQPLAPEPRVERPAGLAGAATASGRAFTLHPRVLVLLVDFADRPANPALWSPEVYEQRLFSLDTQEFGSLRDYYRAASYGAMDVTGEVFGWFRMPQPYTFYVNGREGTCSTCYPNNARGLVADALQAAVDGGIVFSRFDNDGPDNQPGTADDDGLLDGLLVVFPGLGAERTFSAQDFRSHYWDVTANRFVGDTEVPDYALIAGDENIGVSVHEFGHILGGDDLYDLSGQTPGLGDYSVMARAMWFNNGRSPGGPDPFTRMQWGLLEPEVIRADEPGLTLPRILDAPAAFRLWTRGEPGDEFFLVENRNPTGIDRFLPGDGVLVYHIDRSVPRQQNAAHFRVSLVQADGLNSLHGGFPPNSGEPGDFLPGKLGVRTLSDHTVPDLHTHAGHPSQVALTVPGDPGPEMLVDVVVGVPLGGDPRPAVRVEPSEGLFAAGVSFGETRSLELVVQNRGTRLAPSRLLLSSADPRVRVLDPGPFDVARIPALGSVRVPGAVRFSLDTAPEDRRVLPVEAVLSGESGVYRSVARLPLESSVVLRESFETEGAGRVVSLNATPPAVWERSPRRATHGRWSWWTRGGSLGYPERVDEVLVLGPFPVTDAAELRFSHYVDTQSFNGNAHDGGFVEVSRDSGATWQAVAPEGGYPAVFTLTDGNAYPGQGAWAGPRETWEEVVVPLVGFAGDLLVRFHFVSDFSASLGLYEGWYVDAVSVRTWDVAHAGWIRLAGDAPGSLDLRFLPLAPGLPVGQLRLVLDNLEGRQVLRAWDAPGNLSERIAVPGASAERLDAYTLEWQEGGVLRRSPTVFSQPADAQLQRLFAGTPPVVTRAAGGFIRYRVPESGNRADLTLFDARGRRVRVLAAGPRAPGVYAVPFPTQGEYGKPLAAGIYFLRLETAGVREHRRMVVLP